MGKWYESAVFYHMYPLGMLGAPKQNDGGEVVHRLPELLPWADHIRDLGCTAVYIGPLFESASHGYDTRDYRRLDCRLGTNADFAKAAELEVYLDEVPDYLAWDFSSEYSRLKLELSKRG